MALGAFLQRNRQSGPGVGPERGLRSGSVRLVLHRERPGVATVRVIGAADEGAEFAELEAEPAGAANRTETWVAPGAVIGEKMPPECLIEGSQHLADRQILGAVDRGGKIPPEVPQHLLPVDASARDVVELIFEVGGKVVLDVAFEEVRQKCGDEASTILGKKTPLFEPDIVAILQNLQDRGVGRGPADAELFELFDEAGFGVARRRLREMLARRHLAAREPLGVAHRRQATAFAL